jgi:uncharacterized OsmC-like protein
MSESEHIENFQATAVGSGWPTSVSISDSQWSFKIDESEEDGGSNSGPNPMHHFVASLAGCQNEQAQVVADELGLKANDIKMSIEVALDLSGFMGIKESSVGAFRRVNLRTTVAGLTDEQSKNLGDMVDVRCPILGLLRSSGVKIESTWVSA